MNNQTKCGCRSGQERDNCPVCEGTGYVIDFAAIRAANRKPVCFACGSELHDEPLPDGTPYWIDETGNDFCSGEVKPHIPTYDR